MSAKLVILQINITACINVYYVYGPLMETV